MHLDNLDLMFWAAGLLGHFVLLFVLLRYRRAAIFPVFTAFVAGNIFRTVVLYVTLHRGTGRTYSFVYWSMAILDAILQLSVVFEMAANVFRPLGKWAPDTRGAFLWTIGVSLAMAAGLSWLAAPVASTWQELLVVKGSFFSSALMSELFVGMTCLSVSVGLPWKTHTARISQGLGTYSIVDIVIEAGHTLYGAAYSTHVDKALSQTRMTAYLTCLTYWIITLSRDAPVTHELPGNLRLQLFTLQRYVAIHLHIVRSGRK